MTSRYVTRSSPLPSARLGRLPKILDVPNICHHNVYHQPDTLTIHRDVTDFSQLRCDFSTCSATSGHRNAHYQGLGEVYYYHVCEIIERQLELNTDDRMCVISDSKTGWILSRLLRDVYCLIKPVQIATTSPPDNVNSGDETQPFDDVFPVSYSRSRDKPLFNKILFFNTLHDVTASAQGSPEDAIGSVLMRSAMRLVDNGQMLVIHRSARLNTLPLPTSAVDRTLREDLSVEHVAVDRTLREDLSVEHVAVDRTLREDLSVEHVAVDRTLREDLSVEHVAVDRTLREDLSVEHVAVDRTLREDLSVEHVAVDRTLREDLSVEHVAVDQTLRGDLSVEHVVSILESVGFVPRWSIHRVPVVTTKRHWVSLLANGFPMTSPNNVNGSSTRPDLRGHQELVDRSECFSSNELAAGVLRYAGPDTPVEFVDRLAFLVVSRTDCKTFAGIEYRNLQDTVAIARYQLDQPPRFPRGKPTPTRRKISLIGAYLDVDVELSDLGRYVIEWKRQKQDAAKKTRQIHCSPDCGILPSPNIFIAHLTAVSCRHHAIEGNTSQSCNDDLRVI